MIPRLQFHYGPAPCAGGDWLDVPLRILTVFMAMLPRIQAQQALQWANVVAFPHLKPSNRTTLIQGWQRTAKGVIEAGHDRYGRKILNSGAEIRAWFIGNGGSRRLLGK